MSKESIFIEMLKELEIRKKRIEKLAEQLAPTILIEREVKETKELLDDILKIYPDVLEGRIDKYKASKE